MPAYLKRLGCAVCPCSLELENSDQDVSHWTCELGGVVCCPLGAVDPQKDWVAVEVEMFEGLEVARDGCGEEKSFASVCGPRRWRLAFDARHIQSSVRYLMQRHEWEYPVPTFCGVACVSWHWGWSSEASHRQMMERPGRGDDEAFWCPPR